METGVEPLMLITAVPASVAIPVKQPVRRTVMEIGAEPLMLITVEFVIMSQETIIPHALKTVMVTGTVLPM